MPRPKTGGRQKGTPNKTTQLLKDAILEAATLAGGKQGLVGYLKKQATATPGPFMALLGKVLPTQLTGGNGEPLFDLSNLTDTELDVFEKLYSKIAPEGSVPTGTGETQH